SQLKSKEKSKLDRLNPKRYIVVTSLGLTPNNKDEIKQLFDPYCLSTGDVYGKDDLNNLLGKHSDIEKQNFKLWLTSQAVMDRIIHSAVFNYTDFEIDSIRQKTKYYVQNKSFFEASQILEEQHYCIISGIPGIGKTTLAEMLIVDYLAKGYEAIKISADMSEAFDVYEPGRKQVFYYDDFLGQTSLENKLNKNEEQHLLHYQADPWSIMEELLRSIT
ncbi:MAG: hypothetical protein M3R24_11425, partial [Chloroflexota bacterium]|nr:hypothetical protein [Chloroflexota bacterium]